MQVFQNNNCTGLNRQISKEVKQKFTENAFKYYYI